MSEAEILQFPKPATKLKVVSKCSFCGKTLIKGNYVQEEETAPAICFDCVKICSVLLGDKDVTD